LERNLSSLSHAQQALSTMLELLMLLQTASPVRLDMLVQQAQAILLESTSRFYVNLVTTVLQV
jgi:CMP-N-acetylneuraminic acid synthetase